jgi:hypothetical protein
VSGRTDTERLDWLAQNPEEMRPLYDLLNATPDDGKLQVIRAAIDSWIDADAAMYGERAS